MRPAVTELSVPFVARLSSFGDRAALVTPHGVVSYATLASRVAAAAETLGTTRRLVLVAGANAVEPIVTYLAALAAGHPVILVPGDNPGNIAAVEAAYDPDVVCRGDRLVERREGTSHDLHPDLALLLSTSGSTGSPKLVRLSRENVQANAESIASYLGIRPTDVAATTLPMHYCYGLSVINSHLLAGASLLLTDLSVVDACFWDQVREHGVTTFAGVPYTFELLDRVGFDRMELPSLRYLTQAGGRLAPADVQRYAELGQRRGWDLFVMYGQTEATARMAYLPPDLAQAAPTAIGIPVPGGAFHLEPLPEMPLARTPDDRTLEVGELVYAGANVMLGYAETAADLARGRDVTDLRTGDVARRREDGMFEIVGRRNRFAKVFGLRVDLDQVEAVYERAGLTVACADGDGSLLVATTSPSRTDEIRAIAKRQFGLPAGAVHVVAVDDLPRLAAGKPDYRAVVALARTKPQPRPAGTTDLRVLFGEILGREHVTDDDTFVSLEGDSLSYVEMSIRLEQALGHLPVNWHVTPIGELTPSTKRRWKGFRSLETNVLLRAVAIVLIVGSHANLFMLMGGAHVLLGVAGFNFGRFHLTDVPRVDRLRHLGASIARIAVPSVLWLSVVAAVQSQYSWQNALLLNGVLGPRGWSTEWHYWFIEALVYTLLALTLVMALPVVDRIERRWSFWLPMMLAGLGLLTRYDVVTLLGGDVIHRANVVFWLFALGWAAVKAPSAWHRLLVSVVVVATVPGFFGDLNRDLVVVVGLLILVWLRSVRVPRGLAGVSGVLASASLYIYLAHWQIYPHLEDRIPFLATVLSLAGGVVLWQVVERATPYVVRGFRAAKTGYTRNICPTPVVEPSEVCPRERSS